MFLFCYCQAQIVLAALTEVVGDDPSPVAYFGALMTAIQQQLQQIDPAAPAADSSLSAMLYLLGCVFPHVPTSMTSSILCSVK